MATFDGFSPAALAFYAALEADNSKPYWQAHKETWEREVRGPMDAFLAALTPEFGPFKIFRPYRDVRFAKDKSPYKTEIGAVAAGDGGAIRYVHLSADGLMAASGVYMLASDQVERLRAAVADDRTGAALATTIAALVATEVAVGPGGAAPLKRVPRGYPPDHPRAEWLRWKGLAATRDFGAPPWLATPAAVDQVAAFWRTSAPLNNWLDAQVGPSREPAQERGRR